MEERKNVKQRHGAEHSSVVEGGFSKHWVLLQPQTSLP